MNGCGKTSILDAIHFLCFTKSYFVHSDTLCVKHGETEMSILGTFEKEEPCHIKYILRNTGKKEFSCNENIYTQLSKHIGQFPAVMIAPDDTEIITEGSEIRRKLLDILISQLHPEYIAHLIRYNKVLTQRNALLKRWHESSEDEKSLLSIYNEQLCIDGDFIFKLRREYCTIIQEATLPIYKMLSDDSEEISITYKSQLESQSLMELLQTGQQKDIITQRSNYGIQKDDITFELNQKPLKQVASQGQRKTFMFSLKLALHAILEKQLQLSPILLLDDIFEKLDEVRSKHLIEFILKSEAQVFITDTHKERILEAFQNNLDAIQHMTITS
jgi:DNA replication and repair protein RecF